MDLRGRLRKAAELFVELPPDMEPTSQRILPRSGGLQGTGAPSTGADSEIDNIDRQLAEQRVALQNLTDGHSTGPIPSVTMSAKPKTVEQIVRDSDGPNLSDIKVSPETAAAPPLAENGALDFAAIYAEAALPTAPFTAEQTLGMLQSLPADLPLAIRRQTVRVTIDAMGKSIGATPETIVADASRKLAALSSFSENVDRHTKEFLAAGDFEIQTLMAQIEEKRKGMADAEARLARVQHDCGAEADRLDDVLEFFSLDTGVSKHASGPVAPTP